MNPTVVVAPNCFRGTLSAPDVADALAAGARLREGMVYGADLQLRTLP